MADDVTDKALLLFQLGPVQSFIAQAITLGDLAVGSEILSEITMAAVTQAQEMGAQLVFPNLVGNEKGEGIPNRFLAFVPRAKAEEIAEACEEAARGALKDIAKNVQIDADKQDAFDKQVERFLQITWAILKAPSGTMGKDYKAVGKLSALRRNTRTFEQWHEEGDGEEKDILSGKETALKNSLGAMNLIKQTRAKRIKIPKEWKNYLAVIAMDGDKMGERLSNFTTVEKHLTFSGTLTTFANAIKKSFGEETLVEKGLLIYAGGDDVIAVVPAKEAIKIAQELRKKFGDIVGGSASAGIAIGHKSVPIQDLVHAAHEAESRAKHRYNRDALAVFTYKRSGEILEWGCNWDSPALDIYTQLSAISKEKEENIKRFPYKLSALLTPYDLKGALPEGMNDVVLAEFKHALEQTEGMKGKLDCDKVKEYLEKCSKKCEDFLNLFMMETFINRPRDGKEDQ